MQHGHLAVATPGSQKSGYFDRPAEGSCFKPAGRLTQGEDSDFQIDQSFCTIFGLRGGMLQPSFADLHTGRGITQGFAFNQGAGERDAVQPIIPYKNA